MNRRVVMGLGAGWIAAQGLGMAVIPGVAQAAQSSNKVIGSDTLYSNDKFYSAFPSIVRRPDGELILAFRRAPERRALGEGGTSHTDPNSYLVLIRSRDEGKTWTREPELIFAHPYGGSQDPCLYQLRDGSILCASYGWARITSEAIRRREGAILTGDFVFMGGYILRSTDGAKTWGNPIIPPPTPGDLGHGLFGDPCPAYNRGSMTQGRDGRLFWAVARTDRINPPLTSVHLMISDDGGLHWNYSCPIAADSKVSFNETSLIETPNGDLVAFLRSEAFDDHTVIARSSDGGRSFQGWKDAGFQGHPHHALRLADGRVLLSYGYRHKPYGIRARVIDPECTSAAGAPEIVLRDDGGNGDLGYPWAVELHPGRVLVVYYFNKNDGPRHIAGTVLETA